MYPKRPYIEFYMLSSLFWNRSTLQNIKNICLTRSKILHTKLKLNRTFFIVFILSRTQLLDLSRNQLNSIGDALASKLRRIKDVKLENNPLICDRCHLGSLIDMVGSVSVTIYKQTMLHLYTQHYSLAYLYLPLRWSVSTLSHIPNSQFKTKYIL